MLMAPNTVFPLRTGAEHNEAVDVLLVIDSVSPFDYRFDFIANSSGL